MTVTENGTQEAATVSTAVAQSRLQQMAAELQGQLDEAKGARDQLVQALKEHDQLVERLQVAVKALSGPTARPVGRPKGSGRKNTGTADRDVMELVEATLARADEPVAVAELIELIPGRSENTIRRAVYGLRDSGRIRLVAAGKGPNPARYAAMPEVVEEHR